MKKRIALLLCLALIVTMIPGTALGEEQSKTLYWCESLPVGVAIGAATGDENPILK